jgi:hypothetical protein
VSGIPEHSTFREFLREHRRMSSYWLGLGVVLGILGAAELANGRFWLALLCGSISAWSFLMLLSAFKFGKAGAANAVRLVGMVLRGVTRRATGNR